MFIKDIKGRNLNANHSTDQKVLIYKMEYTAEHIANYFLARAQDEDRVSVSDEAPKVSIYCLRMVLIRNGRKFV